MTIRLRSLRGFTLVELLVVIGIITVLASLTLVMIGHVRKSADKTRIGFQLQSLTVGLDAYQADFGSYPITVLDNANSPVATSLMSTTDDVINRDGLRGARVLCKALMGATGVPVPALAAGATYSIDKPNQDGKVGLGFAVVGRSGIAVAVDNDGNLKGKSYGPYLQPDKFNISNTLATGAPTSVTSTNNASEKYDDTAVLLDGNGNVILYYPVLNPQPTITILDGFVGPGPTGALPNSPLPMYRFTDNSAWLSEANFRKAMGDANGDKKIIAPETTTTKGKYLLWSPGPDSFYGPNPTASGADVGKFDDVTNFQGE